MSRIITAAALSASFNARNPAPAEQSGTVATISASGVLPEVRAQAMRNYSQVSGSLQWVKAKEHFFVAGETVLEGDLVQVTELDAKRLRNIGRAEFATDEEVAAAQGKATKGK